MTRNPPKTKLLIRIVAPILILAIVGPELGIGLEFIAVIDLMGAGLFLTSVCIGLKWYLKTLVSSAVRALQKLDPFFFIPKMGQITECPAILSHSVPLFVPLVLFGVIGVEIRCFW